MEPNKISTDFYIMKDTTTGEVQVLTQWQDRKLQQLSEEQANLGLKVPYEIKEGKEAWETPGAKQAWEAMQEEKKDPIKDISEISKTPLREVQLIQQVLDSRHIPLTCREFKPPEAAMRNKLDQQAIHEYLEAVRANFKLAFKDGPQSLSDEKIEQLIAAKRRLFAETQCFTYEDLSDALAKCTQKLNQALSGQDYAVGYAEQKSQTWIAELALPLMEKTPKKAFPLNVGGNENFPEELPDDLENFVVFDDASYSGLQMENILENLVDDMKNKLKTQKPRKIYFVTLFMSTQAKESVHRTMEWLKPKTPEELASFPEIFIITSDKEIPGFSAVIPQKSQALEDLFEFELQEKTRELYKLDPKLSTDKANILEPVQEYKKKLEDIYTSDKCLAFMEWKTPDDTSVPASLYKSYLPYLDDKQNPAKKSFKFLDEEFLPPYRNPPS